LAIIQLFGYSAAIVSCAIQIYVLVTFLLLYCSQLNDNRLSSVLDDSSPLFIGLPSLTHLILSSNHIESVSRHALDGLAALHHLDLARNNITSLQNHTFTHLTSLHTMLVCLSVRLLHYLQT